jgi:hypothetical protein
MSFFTTSKQASKQNNSKSSAQLSEGQKLQKKTSSSACKSSSAVCKLITEPAGVSLFLPKNSFPNFLQNNRFGVA